MGGKMVLLNSCGVQQSSLVTFFYPLCLAKTLHNRRINDLEEHLPGALVAMIP